MRKHSDKARAGKIMAKVYSNEYQASQEISKHYDRILIQYLINQIDGILARNDLIDYFDQLRKLESDLMACLFSAER